MRPKKRVAVLDENQTALEIRAMALELWGYRVFPACTADGLALALRLGRMDAVVVVLPRREHRAVLRLAHELGANVMTLDLAANAPGNLAERSLASSASAAEIREALKILTCRKRGPKGPRSARLAEVQAARVS